MMLNTAAALDRLRVDLAVAQAHPTQGDDPYQKVSGVMAHDLQAVVEALTAVQVAIDYHSHTQGEEVEVCTPGGWDNLRTIAGLGE
jgi:hypothetical protein